MGYLFTALFFPLLAPVFDLLFSFSGRAKSFLNGFIVAFIPVLSIYLFYKESVSAPFYVSIPVLVAGFLTPQLLKKVLHTTHKSRDLAVLFLNLSGMALHDFLDGVTLFYASIRPDESLVSGGLLAGILIHRFPAALFFYYFLKPRIGPLKSYAALLLLSLATFLGYFFSRGVGFENSNPVISSLVITFVIGGFLHIVRHEISFHRMENYSVPWSVVGGTTSIIIFAILFWLIP
ncbi:MAG: hypothetical protein K8R21_05785 [Leptospira sp.]|nr:hypothetical protein [Leptospira sp.]